MVCLSLSKTPGLVANQGCVPRTALRGHTEGFVSSHLSQYLMCVTAAKTLMQGRRQTSCSSSSQPSNFTIKAGVQSRGTVTNL